MLTCRALGHIQFSGDEEDEEEELSLLRASSVEDSVPVGLVIVATGVGGGGKTLPYL